MEQSYKHEPYENVDKNNHTEQPQDDGRHRRQAFRAQAHQIGNLVVSGDTLLDGEVGVGGATVDANTQFQVEGGSSSGNYAAKFYAGTNLAAWVRKK